jgi:hypothetical protein
MSHSQTPDSHPICPTCQSDVSEKEDLPRFCGANRSPVNSDDLYNINEEISQLVHCLGALAQAGPLAASQLEENESPPWLADLVWLARELTEETDRRINLLNEAGRIWKQRAEQSPERKEG